MCCNEVADDFRERAQRLPTITSQFAPDQIERLYAVRTFVDHGDPCVAYELLHTPFVDIAVAAKALLRVGGVLVALVREKTSGASVYDSHPAKIAGQRTNGSG